MKYLVVLFALVASTAAAQPPKPDFERLTPALKPADFAKLDIFKLPGSAYTAGWDDFGSVPLRDGYIARFFYRGFDGLMVGVIEDYFGNVYDQTRAWKMGPGFSRFDVTKYVLPDPTPGADRPVAILTFFFYDRATGNVQRFWVAWLDAMAHETPDVPTR